MTRLPGQFRQPLERLSGVHASSVEVLDSTKQRDLSDRTKQQGILASVLPPLRDPPRRLECLAVRRHAVERVAPPLRGPVVGLSELGISRPIDGVLLVEVAESMSVQYCNDGVMNGLQRGEVVVALLQLSAAPLN